MTTTTTETAYGRIAAALAAFNAIIIQRGTCADPDVMEKFFEIGEAEEELASSRAECWADAITKLDYLSECVGDVDADHEERAEFYHALTDGIRADVVRLSGEG